MSTQPITEHFLLKEETLKQPTDNEGKEGAPPILTHHTDIKELMNKLEKEGVAKVLGVLKEPSLNETHFLKIMEEGATEFKEKVGRNMTYSEMRHLYG